AVSQTPGGAIVAGRGEVAAVESEHGIQDISGVANTRTPPPSLKIEVAVNRPSPLSSLNAFKVCCHPGWTKRTPDGRGGQPPVSKTRPSIGEITDRPSAEWPSCM